MDPLQRANNQDESPLFGSSQRAGEIAARSIPRRYMRILDLLRESPSTLIELAEQMHVTPNQISGRLTELSRDGFIERNGQTKPNPATGAPCDVWMLRDRQPPSEKIPEIFGYPAELYIGDDGLFFRTQVKDDEPGIPYDRDTTRGASGMFARISFVDCPGCGTPLKFIMEGQRKTFHCGRAGCLQKWELTTAKQSGETLVLCLIRKSF